MIASPEEVESSSKVDDLDNQAKLLALEKLKALYERFPSLADPIAVLGAYLYSERLKVIALAERAGVVFMKDENKNVMGSYVGIGADEAEAESAILRYKETILSLGRFNTYAKNTGFVYSYSLEDEGTISVNKREIPMLNESGWDKLDRVSKLTILLDYWNDPLSELNNIAETNPQSVLPEINIQYADR